MAKLIARARHDEVKEQFVLAAFVGWQIGAASDKTFGEYLRHLGLSDELPQQVDSRKGGSRDLTRKREDEKLSRMGIKVKKVKQ